MASIDTLPDDALLEIFDSYLYYCRFERERAWQSLVHVCSRWRSIVFGSTRRLDLQLVCTGRTRTRERLDVWPALPLIIKFNEYESMRSVDNIIAGLERTDRVCQIEIRNVPSSDILAAMQQPFPELTSLRVWPADGAEVPVLPDSFLGGSVPRLQSISWSSIPFPGLPKLLLSANYLDSLHLHSIPHSGYFPPDAMVTVLSTLTSLTYLWLAFQSPRSCPDQASRRPPPSTRSVLPGFIHLRFKGVSEYLEDLVACIEAPQLNVLDIAFFNDIEFNTPQFMQFISRTPKSRELKKAHIALQDDSAKVNFSSKTFRYEEFKVVILCKGLEWQVSSLGQVCTSCLPLLSTLEDLYIYEDPYSQPDWKDSIENRQWLELFRPFMAVKNIYLSEKLASRIAPALQELVEGRTTEVLPTLQNIFLEGLESSRPVEEGVGQFVAMRQVVSHPIAVSRWANSKIERRYY